jgi:hypothetical protein
MSTNFLVTQAQRDLGDARVAEIRAVLAYRQSLIEFDRVQEAGTAGVVVSTTAVATTGTASRAAIQGSTGQ